MLQAKPLTLGKLVGTIYDFPEVGDVLPMHTHTEADVHISVVARGSFRAHGNGWQGLPVAAVGGGAGGGGAQWEWHGGWFAVFCGGAHQSSPWLRN